MTYNNITPGIFLSRPNQFIAQVKIDGEARICHVKNTGRCEELLVPGATIYADKAQNPARKTQYDLIAVEKGKRLINMDSQIPNKVFAEWLAHSGYIKDIAKIRPETVYKTSRFDFYIETKCAKIFAEVKGVTLERDGIAMFPDAPTLRGVKHLSALCDCVDNGYRAICVFIIQMKDVGHFTPNNKTHPEFGAALKNAAKHGVEIFALDCHVTPNSITAADFVPVVF